MPNETRPPAGPAPAEPTCTDNTPANVDHAAGPQLVQVQFKGNRKAYYHNRAGVGLRPGQYCLVEADRGRDMGQVKYVGPGQPDWWHQADQQGVLQAAGEADLERLQENRHDESEFWDICRDKIRHRRLDMNLVTVERQFDHKKITFYFTAEQRVDFRELVRDLAAVFRTRIELRQIGVRDEARLTGGLGVCGRALCCSTFLQDFVPVTLKMAKVQQLPLNPAKLSGPCGRLRCCLTYEDEVYKQARRSLPRVGTEVATPDGPGVVRRLDLLQERVAVSSAQSEGLVEWPVARLQWDGPQDRQPERPPDHRQSGPGHGCRGCGRDRS